MLKSYISSFDGVKLWFDHDFSERNVYKISAAYKAVERIVGMNVCDNSHSACGIDGVGEV